MQMFKLLGAVSTKNPLLDLCSILMMNSCQVNVERCLSGASEQNHSDCEGVMVL